MAAIRAGRQQFVDKRHFNVAERKARFRHLLEHCLPEPPVASTRDTCPILKRRAARIFFFKKEPECG